MRSFISANCLLCNQLLTSSKIGGFSGTVKHFVSREKQAPKQITADALIYFTYQKSLMSGVTVNTMSMAVRQLFGSGIPYRDHFHIKFQLKASQRVVTINDDFFL